MAGLNFKSVLITGASRGIGLEMVRQLTILPHPPKHIFATCRNPDTAKGLQELASKNSSVHIHKLDVVDHAAYPSLVSSVEKILNADGLTAIINNAAILISSDKSLDDVTVEGMMEQFACNAVAPLMLIKAFLPLLKKAAATSTASELSVSKAAIINISSSMGSIGENASGNRYGYRSSKAALNMITKSLSIDLKSDGVMTVILHPGWVQTDMGGTGAMIDTATSVGGMFKVLGSLTEKDTGCYRNYKGDTLLW